MIYLTSSLLDSPDIKAVFTTRNFGFSKSPYSCGNLAFHVGDDRDTVIKNHQFLADELGYHLSNLIHMKQIHSNIAIVVGSSHSFVSPPECDALITDKKEVPLMVMSADCTPILIHDPIRHVIAAVHAGRAGALDAVLPKTIEKMEHVYGTKIKDLKISLGPSIHGCCYEINEMIAENTVAKGYETALRKEDRKYFLDVNTILLTQLSSLGIQENNIEVINTCTSCENETFFSYRAHHQNTGRIAGIIMLRS